MLLRYIVFYCELGCDTSEPHVSYISRACSSLVRQPYYAPNCIILKISGLVVVLTVRKVHWAGRTFYMDEYTLIFLFSRCARCAQKRDCWESVRFASERSRVRIPLGPLLAAAVILTLLLLCVHIESHAGFGTWRAPSSTALPQAGQATSPVPRTISRRSEAVFTFCFIAGSPILYPVI